MKVAIVKYNAGNIRSVIYALNRLGIEPILTDDEAELRSADKVIFPGVGEASSAMRYLKEAGLDKILPTLTQPFLGICIGQHLMCQHSEEGDVAGLGIFPLEVKKFDENTGRKVPHMGWNKLANMNSVLFEGIEPEHAYVYYVHSYYCELSEDFIIASTDYVNDYSGALHKDNFYSVQFHPEKSGDVGEQVLRNFIKKT
jgi:glutamine amidotransferase